MGLRLPEPEASGFADVAGVQIAWKSFGKGESAVLVIPTWNFVDSRVSAFLVADLSRSFRVVTFDPRGAGRSDRPPTGYRFDDHLADAVAVLRAAGVGHASLVAGSIGANTAALLAARLPDQVERLVLIAPAIKVGPAALTEDDNDDEFWIERASYEGRERWSAPYWRQDWPGFARWFLETAFNEPGSEALIDAILQIALEADPEILIQQHREMRRGLDVLAAPAILGTISSPTLVLHGELDRSVPLDVANAVAAAIPGAALAVAVAGGHRPDIRSPELINPLLVDFLRGRQLTARPGIEIRQ
ncbi:MAG: alpha/beta fold hydrolase [Candidatus Limnocylindria bacterium]